MAAVWAAGPEPMMTTWLWTILDCVASLGFLAGCSIAEADKGKMAPNRVRRRKIEIVKCGFLLGVQDCICSRTKSGATFFTQQYKVCDLSGTPSRVRNGGLLEQF